MGNCKFSNVFNRLRKSSSDSIDNVEYFDGFKEYIHVQRPAETDLKDILRKVNASSRKTLVLLCGSAGDGKSHLLSYLKNVDEEKLIENYFVYNDATESSSPSMTAIETLNNFLDGFKDNNLSQPGQNIILAINLGVLSNFIESEYGSEYSILRRYVEESNILTSQINHNSFDSESHFQHVSFSDYHMYSLTEEGVHAGYIEDILKKVFTNNEENIFYHAYENACSECPLSQKCPVKKNYEYMMDEKRQVYISELLVKVIIQNKLILTTREILNFIYDIIISQSFSFTNFQKLLVDDTAYLKEFLKQITPALLFDSADVTLLLTMLQRFDPLLHRSENADTEAISYYVSTDVSKDLSRAFGQMTYKDIICNPAVAEKVNDDKAIKAILFNLMVRVQTIDNESSTDDIYTEYLSDLYLFNAGKGKKLGSLYGKVEKAVTQWCGSDEDGNLCLNDNNSTFLLYENVKFEENLDYVPKVGENTELQRFIPSIIVAFDGSEGDKIVLDIDYALYEMICKLNKGYIQTADDRNSHADFISFVNRILQSGSLTEKVEIVSVDGRRASISQGKFGYKFKAVR